MTDARTVPHRVESLPVRTLKAVVLKGPDEGKTCVASSDTITVGTALGNDLVLSDETVSRYHLDLKRTDDRILVQDHDSTNGTSVRSILLERARVPPGTILELGRTSLEITEGETIDLEVHELDRLGDIRGRTPEMRRLMNLVERVAKTDTSVLLLGETGTGKEVFARAIHQASPRAQGPFEAVDCGSLLATLIASELFGHEKGAFTGAEQRHIGAFERADGGTLFLDEIGELPTALQATLLGALERRSFRRIGGSKPLDVNVRLICATNRDLRSEVNGGTFRADLYYRIAVVLLRIPPLRERVDDIPLLVEEFLRGAGHDGPVEGALPRSMIEGLKEYRWPGNVRELRNFVEAALALGEAPPLEVERTPSGAGLSIHLELGNAGDHGYHEVREAVLREFERRYLTDLLDKAKGNVALAARQADMDRTYLMQLLKKLGLRREQSTKRS
ncbi:MAG: sigma 54-dependent Fis family transcriptional regulator [Deltaproteobacteria bacterium]|nr:sigma 54-dependent Fis family transcriptional regulator [Deltaproteobacteria bacterium]